MPHPPGRRLTIAPSLLSADFARLKDEVRAIEAAGADWLHLDVMDGHFVPNLSFGPLVLKALRPHTSLPFDVHLMISPVDPFIAAFAEAGADHMLLHPEAGPHPHRSLQAIRALGKRAGVVLNPGTPIDAVAWLLDLADIVLVMTVNPGFGGQAFLPSQLAKIAGLRRLLDATDHPIALAVDGGIGPDTARLAVQAGADTLIAGSAVYGAPDYTAAIAALRSAGTPANPPSPAAPSSKAPSSNAGPPEALRMNASSPQAWLRMLRRQIARLPRPSMSRVPDAPIQPMRDVWPGDAQRGARLLRGEMDFGGATATLQLGSWPGGATSPLLVAAAHGFAWLRDLREIGSPAALLRARALVGEWIAAPPTDPIANRPDVSGARIAAWLGHYDFFAATADDGFRQKVMARLVADARRLSAALPTEEIDGRALTALKGLTAVAVALPDQATYLKRVQRFLPQEIARQVLPDGCHAERSPVAHLAALQDLIDIRALLQSAQTQPPAVLTPTIERMSTVLRFFRHGDLGLAQFNGTKEEAGQLIDQALARAGRSAKLPLSLPDGGFQRLQAGRTTLIVDCGAPAPPGLDRYAHAGTLAMEMSVNRERVVVNCGGFPAGGEPWRDATRATAAHSTLVIADVNSSELQPHGLGHRPTVNDLQRQEADGAHWLEVSHDGWKQAFGAIHRRSLYIASSGDDVRGEDTVEAFAPQPFTLRFHLHPDVTTSPQQGGEAVLLRLRSGAGWRLRADGGRISIEDSIYLGGPEPRRSEQVVVTGSPDGPQQVKWAISKVG